MKRFSLSREILLLFPMILLSSCSTPQLPESSEPLLAIMAQRLSMARDVAWAKQADGLPVRDPAREQEILQKLVRQGEAADLDEGLVARFIRAQIEASCLEQEAWMSKWKQGEPMPAGDPPDLEKLRSRLDRLSSYLVAEYAAAWNTPAPAARARLEKTAINPRAAAAAASGFITR